MDLLARWLGPQGPLARWLLRGLSTLGGPTREPYRAPGVSPGPEAGSRWTAVRTPASASTVIVASFVDSVDVLLDTVPNPVPSAGQLRQARGRGGEHLSRAIRPARRPLLAGIGTADLILDRCRVALAEATR